MVLWALNRQTKWFLVIEINEFNEKWTSSKGSRTTLTNNEIIYYKSN